MGVVYFATQLPLPFYGDIRAARRQIRDFVNYAVDFATPPAIGWDLAHPCRNYSDKPTSILARLLRSTSIRTAKNHTQSDSAKKARHQM